jgi:hypothetical protein
MLGRFLELALVTEDPGAGWNELRQLGFADAPSGDIWTHAYGVAACEGLAIGLHARGDEPLSLVFVRPQVAELERDLSARFIEVESVRLGSDVFNELGFRDPGGTLLRVIEARTFSPPSELPEQTALGRFRWISLPCANLADAQGFWERLDMDILQRDVPWPGIAVEGLPISYHESSSFSQPALVFDGRAALDDQALRAAGAAISRPLPALRAHGHRVLRSVEGMTMILLGSDPAAGPG